MAFFKGITSKLSSFFQFLFGKMKTLNWRSFLTSGVLILFIGYLFFYVNLKNQICIFKYAYLPEELTKQGYTQTYIVNQIVSIKNTIMKYTPEIREDVSVLGEDLNAANSFKKFESFSSDQMEAIEHMEIGGVSIEALIVITDKIVRFFGFDSDNYLTLEFTKVKDSSLQLAATLAGTRTVFVESYTPGNVHQAIALLNIKVAKLILQKKEPTALFNYLYNSGQENACILACQQALLENINKQVQADAYGFMGLCAPSYPVYLQHIKKAKGLDKANGEWCKLLAITNAYAHLQPTRKLDSLVRVHPTNYPFHLARFSYHLQYDTSRATHLFNAFIDTLKKEVPEYSSVIHYFYAAKKSDWAQHEPKWLDESIIEYKKAITLESRLTETHKPNPKLLANYYNNLAFNFEKKILNTYKSCADSIQRDYFAYLDSCYWYVQQAVQFDPKNKWAQSTLAEYYGLQYLFIKDDSNLANFNKVMAYAYSLGYTQDDWNVPPYCLAKKEDIAFKGYNDDPSNNKLEELRQLNVLADLN